MVTNHEISRGSEPPTPNPHKGRSVEHQIRYLNYRIAPGASTASVMPIADTGEMGKTTVLTHMSKQTEVPSPLGCEN